MQRKLSILLALCLVTALVAGCISSDESESTTTALPDTYFLSVTVDGGSPIEVSLSEIKSLEYETITATMVKKTGAEIETTWGGTSFYGFMDHIGVEDAQTVTMIALDGYQKELEYAQLQQAMLAWHDENGDTIPEEDGGPIRFVAPGLPANTWMQNLVEIQVTAAPQDTASLTVTVDGTSSDVGLSELQSLEYTSLTADDVEWGGALISDLMAHLEVENASTVTFMASDGYNKEVDYADLSDAIVAWHAAGEEIPEDEGGPLRIIAPSLAKSAWVGNLVEIQVTTAPQDTFYLDVTVDGETVQVGLSDLQSLELTTVTADDVEWGGALISDLMAHLGIDDATTVTFFASDGYNKEAAYVDLSDAIVAWHADGEEIPEDEGGPLRIIAPSLPKSNWVGNLVEIQIVTGG